MVLLKVTTQKLFNFKYHHDTVPLHENVNPNICYLRVFSLMNIQHKNNIFKDD